MNWGNGGGWADATFGPWPDWVEVDFSGAQTIGKIDVFTKQGNDTSPSDPTPDMPSPNTALRTSTCSIGMAAAG